MGKWHLLRMIVALNKMEPRHTSMNKLRKRVTTIFLRSSLAFKRSQFKSIGLLSLGRTCSNDGVTSKKSLIMPLKRAVSKNVVLKVADLGPIDYIRRSKLVQIIRTTILLEN